MDAFSVGGNRGHHFTCGLKVENDENGSQFQESIFCNNVFVMYFVIYLCEGKFVENILEI